MTILKQKKYEQLVFHIFLVLCLYVFWMSMCFHVFVVKYSLFMFSCGLCFHVVLVFNVFICFTSEHVPDPRVVLLFICVRIYLYLYNLI